MITVQTKEYLTIKLATIILLQGSYTCGFCNEGYMGNPYRECVLDDYCLTGMHNCGGNATCYYSGPALFRCQVSNLNN